MTENLLPIGAFSRASSLSVRTLRNYHESGLLVPASIDPATGYRSYTVDQLADALVIVRLRALDVPLPAVHRVLHARDPELTREVLAEHERHMRARLEDAERIVAALQYGFPAASTPAHVVTTPSLHTLEIAATVSGAALWSWLERAAAALREAAVGRMPAEPVVCALYTGTLTDEENEDVVAWVEIDEPFLVPAGSGLHIGELPARTWAVLIHTEGFDTVGDTYRLLGAWVARHADPMPDAPICERYPNILAAREPPDDVIEIRWPLVAQPARPQ